MGETMERLESQEGHQAGHKADWKLFKFMVERLERLRKGLRRV